jgi:flavin-binding protein dodecin
MSVAKVTEIMASSTKSFDDAIQIGVARAQKNTQAPQVRMGSESADQVERSRTNHGIPRPVEDYIPSRRVIENNLHRSLSQGVVVR